MTPVLQTSFAQHRHPFVDVDRFIVSSSDDDATRQTTRSVKDDELTNAVPIIAFWRQRGLHLFAALLRGGRERRTTNYVKSR